MFVTDSELGVGRPPTTVSKDDGDDGEEGSAGLKSLVKFSILIYFKSHIHSPHQVKSHNHSARKQVQNAATIMIFHLLAGSALAVRLPRFKKIPMR